MPTTTFRANNFMFTNRGPAGSSDDDCVSPLALCGDENPMGNLLSSAAVYGTDDTDAVLAKELHDLSIQERERVFDEIHGVAETWKEDPAMVAARMTELDDAIKKIRKRAAFERALFLSPRYVKDPAFRLMFLRAEHFDAQKAAVRMIDYFRYKLELFGEEKLVKRITLDDLGEDDKTEVKSGAYQFLAEKDRSKRAICIIVQKRCTYTTWQSKLRSIWYWIMTTLEDEDAQKNGFVNVFYNLDMSVTEKHFLDLLPKLMIINDSLPYRSMANHYCYNDPRLRPALRLFQMTMGKENRVRFRAHFGSHMECQYSLMTFGIPKQYLPMDGLGNFRVQFIDDFLERRRAIESAYQEELSRRIDFPSKQDVLLGRGKPYQEYSGNLLLAQLIDTRRDEYNRGGRFEKTCISMDIAKTAKDYGVRFLQRDEASGGWVEADDAVAREKVSSGFRTKTRRSEKLTSELTDSTDGSRVHNMPDSPGSDNPQQKRRRLGFNGVL